MNRRHCKLTLALLTVWLGACAPPRGVPSEMASETESTARSPIDAKPVAEPVAEVDPSKQLEQLERRLNGASRVEFEFAIDSAGAVISHFTGRVRWVRDGEFTLTAEGEFAGQPQQLELRGDASTLTTMVAGSESWSGAPLGVPSEMARPPELIVALVRGLSHMGLLHNLAMLTGGKPPDHADGGAREWLVAEDFEFGPTETREGVELRPLEFMMIVGGQPVSRATLWLDAGGLPVERHQAVEFPEGEMRVVERYSNFVVEP